MKTFAITIGGFYSTMFYLIRTTTKENARLFALEAMGCGSTPIILKVEEVDITAEGIIFEMYTGE